MPIELRRLLIGDPYGDFNFLKFPNETTPTQNPYASTTQYHATFAKWHQQGNIASFLGGMMSLHARHLRATYGTPTSGVAVSHSASALGAGAVARFGLGANPAFGGSFTLGDPNGKTSVTPSSANTFYELRWNQPASGGWWRVAVNIPPSGGTQDLDEVRLWEFIDIEPYLEELIPSNADTEVFQMPFGRYFVGSHYRWTSKRLTISLLFSRTATTLRKQLEAMLTKPSARYPLELFIDGYLFRCAPADLRFEPIGGLVMRAVIELQLLQPYGYHQNRFLTASPPTYPSADAPIRITAGNSLITAETPCEVRVYPGSAVNGYKIRITVAPSGQQATFVLNGTEGRKVISFQEDGCVLKTDRGVETTVTDVTNQLTTDSQLPFVLHPAESNVIYVEYLDNNNNPLSDTTLWEVACAFNPRSGEVVLL